MARASLLEVCSYDLDLRLHPAPCPAARRVELRQERLVVATLALARSTLAPESLPTGVWRSLADEADDLAAALRVRGS